MASCIHYAHPCMFRMFLNICTHAVSNNFSLLWIYTAWLRVHSFSICKCQLPEDPHTAEPDDAINSIILNQRFVLSSLTRNYFGANPSLLSEQNLWPHMLCSGQHQTFNCVWVKKHWHKVPHFTIWFLMAWVGWTNPDAFSRAAEMNFMCLCVFFVLFLSKGSFL